MYKEHPYLLAVNTAANHWFWTVRSVYTNSDQDHKIAAVIKIKRGRYTHVDHQNFRHFLCGKDFNVHVHVSVSENIIISIFFLSGCH